MIHVSVECPYTMKTQSEKSVSSLGHSLDIPLANLISALPNPIVSDLRVEEVGMGLMMELGSDQIRTGRLTEAACMHACHPHQVTYLGSDQIRTRPID